MTSVLFSDGMMMGVALVGVLVSAHYAYHKKDYVVAAWILPLIWISLFYGILTFGVDPIHDDLVLRVALFRPGMFFLLAFMLVHFANGRVNDTIAQIHAWILNTSKELLRWTRRFKP